MLPFGCSHGAVYQILSVDLPSLLPSQDHGVFTVYLRDLDLDPLAPIGRDVLAYEVRAYRKLAMSAIDKHRELDSLGPTEIQQSLQCSSHGPAGVQNIVDDHDRSISQLCRNFGRLERLTQRPVGVVPPQPGV